MSRTTYFVSVLVLSLVIMVGASNLMAYYSKTTAVPTPKLSGLNPVIRLVKDGRTFCSGVVIDSTTIVTAAHCVLSETLFGAYLDPAPIEIRASDNLPRGTTAKIKEGTVSTQMDRAILKGDFSKFAPATYISDVAESVRARIPGAYMKACGYPLGGRLYCSNLQYDGPIGFFMKVTGVLIPGMSGGPTMTESGDVIAVNTAVSDDFSIVSPIYGVDLQK